MAVVAILGGGDGVEEPDWTRLIPDAEIGSTTVLMDAWRDFAHRQWNRICQELREAGTLAPVNGHQIQRLVLAYVRYDMAAAKLMAMSVIINAPKTGVPLLNIWQVEMRAADSDATTAEMELCLNPRRRGAATKAQRKERKTSAADGFLGKKSA